VVEYLTITQEVSRIAGNEMVRKAVTEAGKKIVATTAKRAGDLAG